MQTHTKFINTYIQHRLTHLQKEQINIQTHTQRLKRKHQQHIRKQTHIQNHMNKYNNIRQIYKTYENEHKHRNTSSETHSHTYGAHTITKQHSKHIQKHVQTHKKTHRKNKPTQTTHTQT